MHCKMAQMLLEFHRPHASELEPDETRALEAHLSSCPACRHAADEEHRMTERLGLAMRAVALPPGLRDRLLTRLSNERNASYRGWLLRGVAAAAALVLMALGISWYVSREQAEISPFDVDALVARFGQAIDPEVDKSNRPEDVVRSFQQRGVPIQQMPEELVQRWDFTHLQARYVTWHNGRLVPTLEFATGSSRAVVLLLHRDAYETNSLPSPDQSRGQFRVLGQAGQDEYIALVVVQAGKYEDFLKPQLPPTA